MKEEMPKIQLRENIKFMETQEVIRLDDVKGREYMWDGIELYRLTLLKGKFGRNKLTSYKLAP